MITAANVGSLGDERRDPLDFAVGAPDLPAFWLSTTREFAHLTIWLHGELDLAFNDQLVSAACANLAIGRTSGVTVDLGGLDFLSVTGIGALLAVRHIAEERRVPFALRNVPAKIRRLFGLSGDARNFPTRWRAAPRAMQG